MMKIKKLILIISILLINACSKEYYPWTDSKLPKWAAYNIKNVPDNFYVEQADFGPVNKSQPFLWCYKYKDIIIVYELDNKGIIWKYTV